MSHLPGHSRDFASKNAYEALASTEADAGVDVDLFEDQDIQYFTGTQGQPSRDAQHDTSLDTTETQDQPGGVQHTDTTAGSGDAMDSQTEEGGTSEVVAHGTEMDLATALASNALNESNVGEWILAQGRKESEAKTKREAAADAAKRDAKRQQVSSAAAAAALTPARLDAGHTMSMRAGPSLIEVPYCSIKQKRNRERCFIQVSRPDGTWTPLVGSHFSLQKGWMVQLCINPGRFGEPSLSFEFRFNKKSAPDELFDTKDPSQGRTVIQWTPGIGVQGNWMIDEMSYAKVSAGGADPGFHSYDFKTATMQYAKEYLATEGNSNSDKAFEKFRKRCQKTVAMHFRSSSALVLNANANDWEGLPSDVVEVLNILVFGNTDLRVNVFWDPGQQLDAVAGEWLNAFQMQINEHIAPFHAFLKADGTPLIDFEKTPTVDKIGGGMYIMNPDRKPGTPLALYEIKPRLDWMRLQDFHISLAMPVVREYQYSAAQLSHLQSRPLEAYFQVMPTLTYLGEHVAIKDLENMYFVFIRIKRLPNGLAIGQAPEPNSPVPLELDNSTQGGWPHKRSREAKLWKGHVVADEAGVRKTKTTFCVAVQRPADSTIQQPRQTKTIHETFALEQPDQIRLYLADQGEAARRELKAAGRFASHDWDPETIGPVREAFMTADVSSLEYVSNNLVPKDNGETFQVMRDWFKKKLGFNKSQLNVLDTLKKAKRIEGCVGPPGTGKTITMAKSILLLVANNHPVLSFGPSNMCVDRAANQVWKDDVKWNEYASKNRELKEVGRRKRYLRLEVEGAELRAMTAIAKYTEPKEEDQSRKPQLREEEGFLDDDPQARQALMKLMFKQAELDKELAQLQEQSKQDQVQPGTQNYGRVMNSVQHYAWALRKIKEAGKRRVAGVPLGMTSAWHLFWQCRDDEQAALRQEQQVLKALQTPATQEDLDRGVTDGSLIKGSELYNALKEPVMSIEQAEDQFKKGRYKYWHLRDLSAKFKELQKQYIELRGNLPRNVKKQFHIEWALAMRRVFAKMDVIFTTCNNAGSDLLADAFHPTVLMCDEAGQAGMASVTIPMTQFQQWLVVFLVGDPLQLEPWGIAGATNEFRALGKISPLGSLKDKHYPLLWLDTQYTMHPEIAKWPAKFFYDGNLKSAPSTSEENDECAAVKILSRKYLSKRQSPYFLIDVVNGISRPQEGGNSSENHTNANSIIAFVFDLLKSGVRSDKITILTYYTGQKSLLRTKLRERCSEQDEPWDVDNMTISTVDAFQGGESSIILLDLVIAKPIGITRTAYPLRRADNDDDDDENENVGGDQVSSSRASGIAASGIEDQSENVITKGKRLSQFMTNPHRLGTAMTRARAGLIVFCKTITILAAANKNKGKAQGPQALAEMVRDARARGLIGEDSRL